MQVPIKRGKNQQKKTKHKKHTSNYSSTVNTVKHRPGFVLDKTPHTSPVRAIYGVSFASNLENMDTRFMIYAVT